MFDYFYGIQSEQFAFYRIPKVLFTDDRFRVLSAEAKTLYGILLDRVTLSAKNGWIDQQGRVYIIYTIEEIMADMNCGNKKAIQLLSDLEEKVGLIERKRQGLGKPNLIYVKNFISVESHGEGHFLNCQKHTSGNAKSTSPEMAEGHGRNTDTSNTENSDMRGFCDERQEMRNFRLDRIAEQPSILNQIAVMPPEDYNPADYSKHVFRMYDTDEPITVQLYCHVSVMKYLIDNFGTDFDVETVDDEHFKATVSVCASTTFYSWVFGFNGKIKISEPSMIKLGYKEMLQSALAEM